MGDVGAVLYMHHEYKSVILGSILEAFIGSRHRELNTVVW